MEGMGGRYAERAWGEHCTLVSKVYAKIVSLLYMNFTGTTYIQEQAALLVIAGVCVFSTASALFMFPAMYLYYQPALNVYGFERADGIGRAHDIVIQGFIRFQSISFLPVIFSTTLLYLLVGNWCTLHNNCNVWLHELPYFF